MTADAPGHHHKADTVQISTTRSLRAHMRRPGDRVRSTMLVIALIASIGALATDGFSGRSAATATVATDNSDPATVADILGVERIADPLPADTTATPADRVRTPGPALVVPDPRPGDLRVDPDADVLPAGFVAAPAAEIIRDVPYGPDDIHRMDLYLPEAADAPVLVFLHSGGWVGGDRSFVPELVLRHLERGYAVASVEYRLAPAHPFPAPIHDTKRAVRELKVIAAETGRIDGDSIVLFGTSAGGHLAAFVGATDGSFEPTDLSEAQTAHDSSVAGIVVAVGPTDLVQLYSHENAWAKAMTTAHAGCLPCTVDQLDLPSVATHLHDNLPPAYWAYGELDPLVDPDFQGRLIAEAWAQAAGSEYSWFDFVEGSDHNLDETVINQRVLEIFLDHTVGRI
jgi:acetyl esterase/lipase